MAEEKKLSQLDVKDIFSKVNLKFIFTNKSFIYVTVSFVILFVLLYFIYSIFINQDAYESQKQRFNLALNKANNAQKEIETITSKNKNYIKQLSKASKTKSELSSKITKMINNYGLELENMDLKTNQNGVSTNPKMTFEVKGKFLNITRFNDELNNLLAATQINELKISKVRESGLLLLKVDINFSPPPINSLSPSSKLETIYKKNISLSKRYTWSDLPKIKREMQSFIKVGFVESESDQSSEIRDPFAAPDNTPKAIKNSSDNYDELDESYFLSGTLLSDKKSFCIIISPEGDSKYYVEGDFITKNNKKIVINKILTDQIFVGKNFNLIKVGDEVK